MDSMPTHKSELERTIPPRPIRNEEEYENVRMLADRLAVLNPPTKDQKARVEALVSFMEAYEEANHKI
jgi:antitoxin component HigA of HigAB toxin-antitoxin module